MNEPKKLKPKKKHADILSTIFVSIVMCIIFAVIGFYFDRSTINKVVAILLTVGAWFDLMIWLRTRNTGHLVAMGWQSLFALMILSGTENKILSAIYPVLGVPLMILYLYYLFSKKTKWRYREILELAAKPVNETDDGFTDRPYPSGKGEFSKIEINGFAKFLRNHHIALPYPEDNRIVFQVEITIWHLFFLRYDYSRFTHIAFDYDGNMTVYISKKSYSKYKDELSFDQLCDSTGNLFREFLELYRKEEKSKIIDRLNALKLNIFEN